MQPDARTRGGPPVAQAVEEAPPRPPSGAGTDPPATRRIADLPADERPREKLLQRGPGSLSDAELLALFLRTGIRGLSAVDLGRRLLAKFGSLTELSRLHLRDLQSQKGVGPAKAMDILAAFELGRRLARATRDRTPLDHPDAVLSLIGAEMRSERCEVLKVVLVNARLHFVAVEEISRGGINETYAHPREILRPALLHAAYGFILVHNHPSGDPAPSGADLSLTRRVRDGAEMLQVRFLDHIIVGIPCATGPGYYSFREAGVI